MRLFFLLAVFLTSSPTWAQDDVGEVGGIRQGKMLIAKSDGWVRMRTHAEKAADGRISFGKESVCETHYITEKVHFIEFVAADKTVDVRYPQFLVKGLFMQNDKPKRIVYRFSAYLTEWIEAGVATGPNQWVEYYHKFFRTALTSSDYMMIKVLGADEEISVENKTIIIPLQGFRKVFSYTCN